MKKNKTTKQFHPGEDEHTTVPSVQQAIVIRLMHRQLQVLLEGRAVPCLLPAALSAGRNAPAVGDRVEIEPAGSSQYKLIRVLPRRTALYRGNRRCPEEDTLIAANADCLLAVVTAQYLLRQAGYLEAAHIAAKRAGVKFGVFVSKWDLIPKSEQALLRGRLELYEAGADFLLTGSALERHDGLIRTLQGMTTVVTGDRGCGKTALIHGICRGLGGAQADTGSSADTHVSTLLEADAHTRLIDTPGFRDFALRAVSEEECAAAFPEIARLASGCAFRDCTHTHESGCEVLAGLRVGQIRRERYEAFQKTGGKAAAKAPKADYRHDACAESFPCKACGALVVPEGAGSQHRNHCPKCLASVHVDHAPGDRAALCGGVMEPVSVWVRKGGEWAIIHRCRLCGALHSNRIAADDNPSLLMSIAVRPLAMTPFPLSRMGQIFDE